MKVLIHNQNELIALVSGLSSSGEYPIKIDYKVGVNRTISQNALSHVIYSDIAKYLISKGRADWDASMVKKSLKNKFLGWSKESYTDILTGEITEREVLRHTADLDKGEMTFYITQVIEWAESIGCQIKIPATCEYRNLMEIQNK